MTRIVAILLALVVPGYIYAQWNPGDIGEINYKTGGPANISVGGSNTGNTKISMGISEATNGYSYLRSINSFLSINNGVVISASGETNISNLSTTNFYTLNKIGIGITQPTHSLTLGSTSNGFVYYNNSDLANYERVRQYWEGNQFNISAESGGSGIARSIALVTANGLRFVNLGFTPLLAGTFQISTGSSIGNTSAIGNIGNYTATAGIQYGLSDLRRINQSGSAGYVGLWISNYEQSTGSGKKLLIDVGTNTEPNGTGNHTSKFNVANTGNAYFAGNLGIGTSDTWSYNLAVAGTNGIIAEKITIKQKTSWPDYVFYPAYKLPSLEEVEHFIVYNKHLPEMPSADDVNNKGLDIASNQVILLKKIEELTLYLIEQNKQLVIQKEDIKILKKELKELKGKN